jgi:membrane associated rhomboid family serine protease
MRYTRYPTRRSAFYGYFPTGIKWLLVSNTLIFVLTSLMSASAYQNVRVLFAITPEAVLRNFFIWQPVTYMFLHGGIWHLIFNMLTLWMFGMQLETDWGTRQFLKYYFICGIGAGICIVAVNALVGDRYTPTLGASGAIMGLLLAFGVLYPNQRVLMSFLFPIKAKYLVMIYAAVELWSTFGPNTGVSSIAHLSGMLVGYIYLKAGWHSFHFPDLRGAYQQWKLQRAKRKFQVYLRKHGRDRGPWVN